MASNIDNTSSFTTSNMKPSADEETAALWGQNIAENTGYLYHQKDTIKNEAVKFTEVLGNDSEIINKIYERPNVTEENISVGKERLDMSLPDRIFFCLSRYLDFLN